MKRNPTLELKILLAAEERNDSGRAFMEIDGYSQNEISYHIKMLFEEGLLEAIDASGAGGQFEWMAGQLTSAGHEYLNDTRDNTVGNMFQNILLEPEQKELLTRLVEISRKMPRDHRFKFIITRIEGAHILFNPGYPIPGSEIFMGDMEILARADLVDIRNSLGGLPNVNVLPLGYAYYEHMKREAGQPMEHVESSVRNYLSAESFRQKYPVVYQKWAEAEDMFWGSDSVDQLTTIGHLCREAVQEFAAYLVEQYKPADAPEDKTKTVARIRAVFNQRKGTLGDKEMALLDALLAYWGTVIDLIQRQEHGGQKEGTPLVWEDARRVVFQTAAVMFEIDHSITK